MNRKMEEMLREGGRTLSEADRQFASLLLRELEQFRYQAPKDRALMFHPLGGYQRYLIHKVTEVFPELASFSYDDEKSHTRRTVVCFKSKRKEQQIQLGQVSVKRRPDSRVSMKDPKTNTKSKTLEHGSTKGPRRGSGSAGKNKLGKYSTWGGGALKKREAALDNDSMKNEVDALKQEPRDLQNTKKHSKHRAKRSHSQPRLNERSRHRRGSFEEFSDQQYSEVDNLGRKLRRPVSENNTPEKRRNKSLKKKHQPVHLGQTEAEVLRNGEDEIQSSSETSDASIRPLEDTGVEMNEIPPSYHDMSGTESKAKRNLRKIKRTNSSRSRPPLDRERNGHANGETLPMKEENLEIFHRDSPVFPRKEKNRLANGDGKSSDTQPRINAKKKEALRRSSRDREPHKASREYVNIPSEVVLMPDENSFSPETVLPGSTTNGFLETTAIVENVHPDTAMDALSSHLVVGLHDLGNLPDHFDGIEKQPSALSSEVPLMVVEATIQSDRERLNKECQTDLHGAFVDAMTNMHNTRKDAFGQTAPLNIPAFPHASAIPPSSLDPYSSPAPSVMSPASAYEKLGEYMYKAMLNFQNMLSGGLSQPANGPAFPPLPTMYAPAVAPAQPLCMPWTPYYSDLTSSHQQNAPCMHQVGEACCQYMHRRDSPVARTPPRGRKGSPKDLHRDVHRCTPPGDDPHHWHVSTSYHHRGGTEKGPSNAKGSMSPRIAQSSKATDGFESDVLSEITNPEVTVADRGEGVVVYVSNRSSSTGGGSVAGSSQSTASDDLAQASPLDHNNGGILRKPSKSSLSDESKKSAHSIKGDITPKVMPKKGGASREKKESGDKASLVEELDFVNVPEIASEEVILSLGSAPLATMEDEEDEFEDSASFTSSRSSYHDNMSDGPRADSANSLVGEDLSPLVGFDDSLEVACEDDNAEY